MKAPNSRKAFARSEELRFMIRFLAKRLPLVVRDDKKMGDKKMTWVSRRSPFICRGLVCPLEIGVHECEDYANRITFPSSSIFTVFSRTPTSTGFFGSTLSRVKSLSLYYPDNFPF